MRALAVLGPLLLAMNPASAQDIRGLENCAAERQMDRRTGCLQANAEFLQQALTKLTRETQQRLANAQRDIEAAKAESAVLREALAKLREQVQALEKADKK